MLPEVEDGSRLAPMHRFHDPTVPWGATLPQWPRIKPERVASINRPHHIVIVKSKVFVSRPRCNPTGIRARDKKLPTLYALGYGMRPRHYRAALCSDAAARAWQPACQACACHIACIRLHRATFGACRLCQSSSPSTQISISSIPLISSGGFDRMSATSLANISMNLPSWYCLTMACK